MGTSVELVGNPCGAHGTRRGDKKRGQIESHGIDHGSPIGAHGQSVGDQWETRLRLMGSNGRKWLPHG